MKYHRMLNESKMAVFVVRTSRCFGSCRVLPYPAVSCRIMLYAAVSCRIPPYPAVSDTGNRETLFPFFRDFCRLNN